MDSPGLVVRRGDPKGSTQRGLFLLVGAILLVATSMPVPAQAWVVGFLPPHTRMTVSGTTGQLPRRASLAWVSRHGATRSSHEMNHNDTDRNDDNDDDQGLDPVELPYDRETALSPEDLQGLTLAQLKQQLRLRGLAVSGNKALLLQRLLRYTGTTTASSKSAADRFVNVSDYVDPEDVGVDVKTHALGADDNDDDNDNNSKDTESSSEPEVWGVDARIVEDYEGRDLVVDGISRTVIEFTGSNQTTVRAYVAASRDALRPFMMSSNRTDRTTAEERLLQIQKQREEAARRPLRPDDLVGLDQGDELGIYKDALHRDFSDWGKYTITGAQLSAEEVEGVLLLSDVYGMENPDTQALAAKIAFECQPVVVMVPDLFRGQPWTGPIDQTNEQRMAYEQWRHQQDELRVSIDIRAAAACLRERYAVSSVVVWGTCYGGGRALEAAAGYLPNGSIHDTDGSLGPPLVQPAVAIAWYPTRYNAGDLFGNKKKVLSGMGESQQRKLAVMGVFGGKDTTPGATLADAARLKELLEEDDGVCDLMVKVFPEQGHGFAHRGLSEPDETDYFERFVDEEFGGAGRVTMGGDDAEVACLLSTAFMETYSRVFLPTTGPPIKSDEMASAWARDLEVKDLPGAKERNVRQEIKDAIRNFPEQPLLKDTLVDYKDETEQERLARMLRSMQDPELAEGPLAIKDEDDLNVVYAKLLSGPNKFEIL